MHLIIGILMKIWVLISFRILMKQILHCGTTSRKNCIALWDGNGGRVILNKHRMPIEKTGLKEIKYVKLDHLSYIPIK